MRVSYHQATLSYCRDLTRSDGDSHVVAMVGVATVGEDLQAWFATGAVNAGDLHAAGDETSRVMLNALPEVIDGMFEEALSEPEISRHASKFFGWLQNQFRNSVYVSDMYSTEIDLGDVAGRLLREGTDIAQGTTQLPYLRLNPVVRRLAQV